jgi:hypothetical protein
MSVVSGILNSQASETAANTQADATTNASNIQLQMYEEGRADTAPWREAGEAALNTLVEKVNAGPGDYTKSPGYDFRTSEGQKAIERSAAAKGGLISGATEKALTKYGQDYATNDYQNYLANYYNSLTPYQSLSGVGQTTASQNAVQGNQVASSVGQNTIAAGNAQATGTINQANSTTGAINSGINNYTLWKYLNSNSSGNAATTAADAEATGSLIDLMEWGAA